MTRPKYVSTLGFKVFSDDLDLIPISNSPARVVNTISPNSYGISTKDAVFCEALKKTDYLVLDGVYFALASILLQGKNIKKNQGPDVFEHFFSRVVTSKKKIFFLGSTPETLEKIRMKILEDYPDIELMYYSPPFKDEFSGEDNTRMISVINNFKPDVLFVGMTCPKQEKWAIQHKDVVKAGLIICIGNVFDWFSGNQRSIHPIWYKVRLAWLIRIFLRPEIFRRNIGNQMKFFSDILLQFLRLKKIKNA